MTIQEAKIKKNKVITELESLYEAKKRILEGGQRFSQTDADAGNDITRVSFPALCNEIKAKEKELESLGNFINKNEGKPYHRRALKIRGC